jgi:hypothetical protein
MTSSDFSVVRNLKVIIDLEDAQAIATNIAEHLQYDDDSSSAFWEPLLCRLNTSIRHAEPGWADY